MILYIFFLFKIYNQKPNKHSDSQVMTYGHSHINTNYMYDLYLIMHRTELHCICTILSTYILYFHYKFIYYVCIAPSNDPLTHLMYVNNNKTKCFFIRKCKNMHFDGELTFSVITQETGPFNYETKYVICNKIIIL